MINYLALLAALCLSGVSAYYSIIGLTAIFASAFWPIIVMGVVLEAGKLVTASWLYRNWKIAPIFLKTYLSMAVIVLMFITSMGIFGFLSKAHIEQSLTINTGTADQIRIIESKIEYEKSNLSDIEKQISQIDSAVSKMTDRGQAASSLRAADQQRKNRDALTKKRDDHVKNLSELNTTKIRMQSEIRKIEAEVGPIRYIADLIFEGAAAPDLEKAVRIVILLLVSVFDPLAIVLLIAANHGLSQSKIEITPVSNKLTKNKKKNIVEISDNDILRFS